MSTTLFDPLQLGELQLANRIVMAPMTRSRATEADLPNALMAEYYAQRASAGLIITEGIHPSANGQGYCRTPGLYTPAHAAAWRQVTDAVHVAGGRIVAQLMHVGRVATHYNKAVGSETVAPSAIRANVQLYTDAAGMVDTDTPRELTPAEIAGVIEEHATAARLAMEAGFDGVELHCCSGYLAAQFLHASSNRRTDAYGGTPERRCRFVLETLSAMADAIGAGRVGYRICPGNPFNDATFGHLLAASAGMGLAYVHVVHMPQLGVDAQALARPHFPHNLIINESFDQAKAAAALAADEADAVAFGRAFIANPDLVRRYREGLALSQFNHRSLYTAGAEGYADYPPAP
jgi:N-ethylmaleimide reductase